MGDRLFKNLLKVSHLREKNLVRFGGAPKKKAQICREEWHYEWEFTFCWWGRKGPFAWVTLVFLGATAQSQTPSDEDEDDEAGYHCYI